MGSLFKLMAMGLVAGAVAAALVVLVFARGWVQLSVQAEPAARISESTTPATDYVGRYRCRPGLTKLVVMRGVEDGFSRQNNEPAVPRAALLQSEYYADIYDKVNPAQRWRDFDVIGVDKILVDRFPVPRDVVSGALVLRVKAESGSANDYIVLGDINPSQQGQRPDQILGFVARLARKVPDPQGVVAYQLEEFESMLGNAVASKLIDHINETNRADELDLVIQDDTAVDFAALILCQLPKEARGTTLREYRTPPFGAGISFLSCGQDRTQAPCFPHSGDMVCQRELPLACYHSGNAQPPQAVQTALGGLGRHFVDGEVRLSPPVAGQRFATLDDANRFCAATFGDGWRVLSYHEGGGGNVISRSTIAPLSRAWLDVRDQRYGNCWDRDKQR